MELAVASSSDRRKMDKDVRATAVLFDVPKPFLESYNLTVPVGSRTRKEQNTYTAVLNRELEP